MQKIDAMDRRIIGVLQANAREPVSSLARKVGLSRSAAQERLSRLEYKGVISGYTVKLARYNPKSLISAYLLLYLDGPICERVVPAIAGIPEVKKSESIGGDIDMILKVEVDQLADLSRVRDLVEAIHGVAKVTTGIVLAERFDRKS